jgi:hypothetical protein
MGMAPEQALAMPMHDYQAAIYHFNRDRTPPDEAEALSDDDFEEMKVAMAAEGLH